MGRVPEPYVSLLERQPPGSFVQLAHTLAVPQGP